MKIAICTPVYRDTMALYTLSLARMILFTLGAKLDGPTGPIRPEIEVFIERSPVVYQGRRVLARKAMAWDAEWLLWIDADQVFPPDALIRLLLSGRGMIGANIRLRNPDAVETNTARLVDGKAEPVLPEGDGIEEILYIGLGFCLVHGSIIKALPEPLFTEEVSDDGLSVLGEDVYFCRKVHRAGFPIFVDHALSREIGHIAETVLTFPA